MISIREAISNLEECDRLRRLTLECYVAALQNAAHYAVDLDAGITQPYRQYLSNLAEEVGEGVPEALAESRATFRGLLRDYRDKASQFLAQLKQELSNSANTLQDLFNSLNQSDGDHETRLRQALKSLRDMASSVSIETARPTLVNATDHIEESLEEMRKHHQATVAQFLVEIRMLHRRIDALENAAALDSLTHVFNRQELERRIVGTTEGASLLLVRLSGLRAAEKDFSPDVAHELAGAFTKRLRNTLAPAAVLGRWGEEAFVAVGPRQPSDAFSAAKWIQERLSGPYACLLCGKTVRPLLQVEVAVVDRPPGEDGETALRELSAFLG